MTKKKDTSAKEEFKKAKAKKPKAKKPAAKKEKPYTGGGNFCGTIKTPTPGWIRKEQW